MKFTRIAVALLGLAVFAAAGPAAAEGCSGSHSKPTPTVGS
jgi:hypothetical protein